MGETTEAAERTYTLAEAARELRKRECYQHGHSWQITESFAGPLKIACPRCGWSGTVTMRDRP